MEIKLEEINFEEEEQFDLLLYDTPSGIASTKITNLAVPLMGELI